MLSNCHPPIDNYHFGGSSTMGLPFPSAPTSIDSMFTATQTQALHGIIDGLLPPLLVPPRENDASTQTREFKTYFESRLATDAIFQQALLQVFALELSTADRLSIQSLLTLLSSKFGTSLLLMKPFQKAFVNLNVPEQSALLSQLQHSTRSQHQRLHRLLQQWIMRTAFTYYAKHGASKTALPPINPHFAAMEYQPSLSTNNRQSASSNSIYASIVYNDKITPSPASSVSADATPDHVTVYCDVLIVGSGPASAVAASVLSKAGYQVLVLEQGSSTSSSSNHGSINNTATVMHSDATGSDHLQWTEEGNSLRHSYLGAARLGGTKECAPIILAGNALGGGSSITYGACLPLSESVWKEWLQTIFVGSSPLGISESGIGISSSNSNGINNNLLLDKQGQQFQEDYTAAMDFVTHKLGISAKRSVVTPHQLTLSHNSANLKLLQACDRLGYPWQPVSHVSHEGGSSSRIDSTGMVGKKTSLSVFMQEAAKFGVRMLDQCKVNRILTNPSTKTSDRPRAIGAECTLGPNQLSLTVVARRAVIMGAGALQTPCLLQKSKLRNRHIGKHLKLHPTTTVFGFMEHAPVDSFLGAAQTVVCREFGRGFKHNGHGAAILCQPVLPGLLSMLLPWTTPYEYKERMRKFRRILPLAIQQRDVSEGSVRVGLDGHTPIVRYSLCAADKVSIMQAMQGSIKLLATAGAKEIVTGHVRDTGLVLGGDDGPRDVIHLATDTRIQKYLMSLPKLGMKPYDIPMLSTYQTGSCRMSSSPVDGVVDTNGECWEVDNLFVMDSSIFPSSPGVNPLLTIMIFAKLLGSRLSMRLRYEDQQPMAIAEAAKTKAMLDARTDARSSFHPKTGRLPSLTDMIPHILLWVTVILIFAPLIFSAVAPEMEVPAEMPPSVVDELLKSPLKMVKGAWRETADFLTFW
ncbi:hypothetical protein MPSEU_001089100 [Mayamaea pseudoterrestris]|nr:hypothetical protein MPSEU_001089100 [Mayamaea pseudoterrestris]